MRPVAPILFGPWTCFPSPPLPKSLPRSGTYELREPYRDLPGGEEEDMVGIFSRFGGRSGHRRTQSSVETRETLPPNEEVVGSTPATASHGIETAVEFKPVEHPIEPLDHDQPITCPLPEPSILNDRRIWKERMSSASARMRSDLPVVKEGSGLEAEAGGKMKSASVPPKCGILPSLSAPEHNILKLLEECSAAGDQTGGY